MAAPYADWRARQGDITLMLYVLYSQAMEALAERQGCRATVNQAAAEGKVGLANRKRIRRHGRVRRPI
jgi:hypothetical protein